jgi:hypothetical protein
MVFVDLAPVTEDGLVVDAVAATPSVGARPAETLIDRVCEFAQVKRLLDLVRRPEPGSAPLGRADIERYVRWR